MASRALCVLVWCLLAWQQVCHGTIKTKFPDKIDRPAPSWLARGNYYRCQVGTDSAIHIVQPWPDYTQVPDEQPEEFCQNYSPDRPFVVMSLQQAFMTEAGTNKKCIDAAFDHFGRHVTTNELLVRSHVIGVHRARSLSDGKSYSYIRPSAYSPSFRRGPHITPGTGTWKPSRFVCAYTSRKGSCSGENQYEYFSETHEKCVDAEAVDVHRDLCVPDGAAFDVNLAPVPYQRMRSDKLCRMPYNSTGWGLPAKSSRIGKLSYFLAVRSKVPAELDYTWKLPTAGSIDAVLVRCNISLRIGGTGLDNAKRRYSIDNTTTPSWHLTEWSALGARNVISVKYTLKVDFTPVVVNCTGTPRYLDGTLGVASRANGVRLGLREVHYFPTEHPENRYQFSRHPNLLCGFKSFSLGLGIHVIAVLQASAYLNPNDPGYFLFAGSRLRHIPPLHSFRETGNDPYRWDPNTYPYSTYIYNHTTGLSYSNGNIILFKFASNSVAQNGTSLRCALPDIVGEENLYLSSYHYITISEGESLRYKQPCMDGTRGMAAAHDHHWWWISPEQVATKVKDTSVQSTTHYWYENVNYGLSEFLHIHNFRAAHNGSEVHCVRDRVIPYYQPPRPPYSTDFAKWANFRRAAHVVILRLRAPPAPITTLAHIESPTASSIVFSFTAPANTTDVHGVQVTCTGSDQRGTGAGATHTTTAQQTDFASGRITVSVLPDFSYVCNGHAYRFKSLSKPPLVVSNVVTPPSYVIKLRPSENSVLECNYPNVIFNARTGNVWKSVGQSSHVRLDAGYIELKNFQTANNGTHVRCGTTKTTKFEVVYVTHDSCPTYEKPGNSLQPHVFVKLYEGEASVVECKAQYRLVNGTSPIVCTGGSLSSTPACEEIRCGPYPYNTSLITDPPLLTSDSYSIGTNLQFNCYGTYHSSSCMVQPDLTATWTQPPVCVAPDLCKIPEERAKCGSAGCIYFRGNHTFTCNCSDGYVFDSFDRFCRDKDECQDPTTCGALKAAVPNSGCHNVPGSYECVCQSGFRTDNTTANAFGFTCSDRCSYYVNNTGTLVVHRNRRETFSCPSGYTPRTFQLSCGMNSEMDLAPTTACIPKPCPGAFGSDANVALTSSNHSLGAVSNLTCTKAGFGLAVYSRFVNLEAKLTCTANTDQDSTFNTWVLTMGGAYVDATQVQCADKCLTTETFPHGRVLSTDIDQPLRVTCDPGFQKKDLLAPATARCRKNSNGFVAIDLYNGHDLPVECEFVNPCAVPAHNFCPSDSTCTSIGSGPTLSITCNCTSAGYFFNTSSKMCEDKNECDQLFTIDPQLLGCSPHAICQNTAGSYQCTCPRHYSGTGTTCKVIDYCGMGLCPQNGSCVSDLTTVAGYECHCPTGTALPKCEDVNECMDPGRCTGANEVCYNTFQSWGCECVAGYQRNLSVSCSDIDECLGNHGCDVSTEVCRNTAGSFRCDCKPGFSRKGSSLVCTNDNECSSSATNSCNAKAHSTCVDVIGSYRCDCVRGYTANSDQSACLDVDECLVGTHTCHRTSGVCKNTDGAYQCSCRSGFQGDGRTCDDEDECKKGTSRCSTNGRCMNLKGSYSCECISGYTGDGRTCTDINECAGTNNCHAQATCTNEDGSYQCECNLGYTGNGTSCVNINECSTTSTCSSFATCTDSPGSYTCQCRKGFSGNGHTCHDNNECILGTHNCGRLTLCENTVGSFRCECESLDQSTRLNPTTCVDIDECTDRTHACDANAACTNHIHGYSCSCNSGYNGVGVKCVDVNECQEGFATCSYPRSICHNTNGSYNCDCDTGYAIVSGSCKNLNECALLTHTCGAHQLCRDIPGSFQCPCVSGYVQNAAGTACQDDDECVTAKPCIAKTATCTNSPGSYSCSCNYGYTGDGKTSCLKIDECTDRNLHGCAQTADCIREDSERFYCECHVGYTGNGNNCSDIDECATASHDCRSPAVCVNTISSFQCICPSGYTGTAETCADINECTTAAHNCSVNSVCNNFPGGFGCTCLAGYQVNATGTCVDINECQVSTACPALSNCTNNVGSFYCTCLAGYSLITNATTGTQTCVDDNECDVSQGSGSNECSANGICTNLIPGYDCSCLTGFSGNGFNCSDIDECLPGGGNNCHSNATCTNMVGSYSCACKQGFSGKSDGTFCSEQDECELGTHNCAVRARCTNTEGSFDCKCLGGYSGNGQTCTDINECAAGFNNSCHANAYCGNTAGSFTCTCDAGYTGSDDGQFCSDIDECVDDLHQCHPKGSCTNKPGSYSCSCLAGYTGDGFACSNLDECSLNTDDCSAQAVCSDIDGSYVCNCNPGWAGNGSFCGDVNECNVVGTCSQYAKCNNRVGSFGCTCLIGYRGNGSHCQDINECDEDSELCAAPSTCSNTVGSYSCDCPPFYERKGAACVLLDPCGARTHNCSAFATCHVVPAAVDTVDATFNCTCPPGVEMELDGSCNATLARSTLTGTAGSNSTLVVILGLCGFVMVVLMVGIFLINNHRKRQVKALDPFVLPESSTANMFDESSSAQGSTQAQFSLKPRRENTDTNEIEPTTLREVEGEYANIHDLISHLGQRLTDENVPKNSLYGKIAMLIQKRDEVGYNECLQEEDDGGEDLYVTTNKGKPAIQPKKRGPPVRGESTFTMADIPDNPYENDEDQQAATQAMSYGNLNQSTQPASQPVTRPTSQDSLMTPGADASDLGPRMSDTSQYVGVALKKPSIPGSKPQPKPKPKFSI